MNLRKSRLAKYFGDKQFYKTAMAVAVPILIQTAITEFVGLLDNIMVGRVGTEQMSGVAISNQLIFVFNLCIFGATSGVGIFSAQYFGSGDDDGMRYSVRFGLYMNLILLVIGASVIGIFNRSLIKAFLYESNAEGDIAKTLEYGVAYIKIILIGLPPFVVTQLLSGTLRSARKTVTPMLAGLGAVLVNLVFNYLLIYGKLGAPALGVRGAAIATVISRYVELAILVIWCATNSKKLTFFRGLFKSLRVPKEYANKFFIKGLPIFLNEALWSTGMTMLMQCYSTRGLDAVAAFNISNTLGNFFNSGLISMGNAVGIIVGNILGAGDIEGAKDADRKLIMFTFLFCTGLAMLLAVVAWFFPLIYDTTADVRELATRLILVVACFMPMNSIVNAMYFTIRAGGKTLITFLFDSAFTWAVPVPVAFLLSRLTTIPVLWMYVIISSFEIIKLTIGFIMLRSGIWCRKFVDATAEAGMQEPIG